MDGGCRETWFETCESLTRCLSTSVETLCDLDSDHNTVMHCFPPFVLLQSFHRNELISLLTIAAF